MNRISILFLTVLLLIGVALQHLLIDTLPRIPIEEADYQLNKSIKILAYQFIFLIVLNFIFYKFVFKEKNNTIIKYQIAFTILYALSFFYLFQNYISKCV